MSRTVERLVMDERTTIDLQIDRLVPGTVPLLFHHLRDLLDSPDFGRVECTLHLELQKLTPEQQRRLYTFLESGWFAY